VKTKEIIQGIAELRAIIELFKNAASESDDKLVQEAKFKLYKLLQLL